VRKLVIILIIFIAVVTFIRAVDNLELDNTDTSASVPASVTRVHDQDVF
jgi:hypothetical protein